MIFSINKKNFENYFLGSLFFGTGGGLPYAKNCALAQAFLIGKKEIEIRPLSGFRKSDVLASVYGVGDPNKADVDFSKICQRAYEKYYRLTGIKLAGIIPGEIGGEIMSFQSAAILGLPVADTDLVGGRAAPEIQLDAFTVFGKPLTPLLGCAEGGKSIFLEGMLCAQEIEGLLRRFFSANQGSGVLVGYPITVGELQKIAIPGTLSITYDFGKFLAKKNLPDALRLIRGRIVAKTRITYVSLKSLGGFFQGEIGLGDYVIKVKNENMALFRKCKKISSAPDLIMLLNESSRPIHNTELGKYLEKKVSIVTAPAMDYWQEPKNRQLWKKLTLKRTDK